MKVKLRVMRGKPQGKTLVFPRGEFVIGRGSECHVRPDSDWVSRQHCMLKVEDGSVSIRDLGSTNGTLVNGSRILAEQALAHGDQVQVGPLVFEVRLEESVLEAASTPLPIGQFPPEGAPPQITTETAEMPNIDSLKQLTKTAPMSEVRGEDHTTRTS